MMTTFTALAGSTVGAVADAVTARHSTPPQRSRSH
jgi:hypothetical protein